MNLNRFVSAYIRAADVKPGEEKELTITGVELETMGPPDERQENPVLYTAELDQGIVLGSRAVLGFLTEAFGPETDDWIGKKVVLYKDPTVMYRGKAVGGLRFKLPARPTK